MLRHDFTATTKVNITNISSVPRIQGIMVSVKTVDKCIPILFPDISRNYKEIVGFLQLTVG